LLHQNVTLSIIKLLIISVVLNTSCVEVIGSSPILSTKAVNQQISSFFSVTYLSTTSNLAVKDLVLDIRKDALAMKLK